MRNRITKSLLIVSIALLIIGLVLYFVDPQLEAHYDRVQVGMSEAQVERILGSPYYSKRVQNKGVLIKVRKSYRLNDRRVGEVEYDATGILIFKSARKLVAPADRLERIRLWFRRNFSLRTEKTS